MRLRKMGDTWEGGKTEGDIESVADRKEIFKVVDKEGRGGEMG